MRVIRRLFTSITSKALMVFLAAGTSPILTLIRHRSRQTSQKFAAFSVAGLHVHGFGDPMARIGGAALRRRSRTRLWGAGQWREAKQ
jgi:hypothetical protein